MALRSIRAAMISVVCTLASVLAASADPTKEAITFTPPSQLTIAMTNQDVNLHWQNHATAPGGCWVEFSTPGDDFTKLDVAWPDVTTYCHAGVAPETKFIYRVHPFYGRPSPEIGVTTGKAPAEAPVAEEEGPLPSSGSETNGIKHSIRSVATFAAATPDGLTAKAGPSTSVELRWNDRAADEDGYLVEVAAVGEKDFKVCALLPPDTTSFKKTQLPPETRCRFRVRAFFYGEPSGLASVMTPPMKMPLKKITL